MVRSRGDGSFRVRENLHYRHGSTAYAAREYRQGRLPLLLHPRPAEAEAAAHADPGEMLGWVNRRFAGVTLPEDFATVFLARWEPATGSPAGRMG